MTRFDETMKFSLTKELNNPAREVIWLVCDALKDKGYDPVNQLVGYIISGDPHLHHQLQERPLAD